MKNKIKKAQVAELADASGKGMQIPVLIRAAFKLQGIVFRVKQGYWLWQPTGSVYITNGANPCRFESCPAP